MSIQLEYQNKYIHFGILDFFKLTLILLKHVNDGENVYFHVFVDISKIKEFNLIGSPFKILG